MPIEPVYLRLLESGELQARVGEAQRHLEACDLCPRSCGANRRQSARDAGCRTGERARVASHGPHYGEEAPLVGSGGSGTIFFSGCNLRVCYVNIMGQYHPCYRAHEIPEISRPLTRAEHLEAIRLATAAGLCRLDAG